MKWETVEILGYSYYSDKGYRILVSLVKNDSYDFVAEKDNNFVRVNVKCASLKDKKDGKSWSIALASGSSYKKMKCGANVDIYLVYLPEKQKFIELPGDFFDKSNSKSKRIPVKMLLL